MASMRNWLRDPEVTNGKRTVVVHCKAGKGRSGTVACSYLISQEGWKVDDALQRFTERRMRSGFGKGVTIPSQLRWIGYVDYWTKHSKVYVERPVEILEVHAWGLREGVKVCVQGYIDEGKKIKTFHTFSADERIIVDPTVPTDNGIASLAGFGNDRNTPSSVSSVKSSDAAVPPIQAASTTLIDDSAIPEQPLKSSKQGFEPGGKAVIFRPANKIVLSSSDVCLDLERRNKAPYGWTLVTAVAHVWFNVYFEGRMGAGNDSTESADRGVFEIDWDAMDGIKGSSRKGVRALDRVAIVWRAVGDETNGQVQVIEQPKPGEAVPEAQPADWSGVDIGDQEDHPDKDIGLRVESPNNGNLSKASSTRSLNSNREGADGERHGDNDYADSVKGVKQHGIDPEEDPLGMS